jgi:hypothetical protein
MVCGLRGEARVSNQDQEAELTLHEGAPLLSLFLLWAAMAPWQVAAVCLKCMHTHAECIYTNYTHVYIYTLIIHIIFCSNRVSTWGCLGWPNLSFQLVLWRMLCMTRFVWALCGLPGVLPA